MGNQSYGVSGEVSDVDIYGVCISPKGLVFPQIAGFGGPSQRFGQWQQHHVPAGD